ncbi:hypothetical protein ABGD92_002403 [Escherichia coli]|nr:hypothetical protein [Escherichia coli]
MQPPEGVPHRLPEHWWSPEGNKVSLYIFKAQKMDVKLFNIDPKRNIMCSLNWFSHRGKTQVPFISIFLPARLTSQSKSPTTSK